MLKAIDDLLSYQAIVWFFFLIIKEDTAFKNVHEFICSATFGSKYSRYSAQVFRLIYW